MNRLLFATRLSSSAAADDAAVRSAGSSARCRALRPHRIIKVTLALGLVATLSASGAGIRAFAQSAPVPSIEPCVPIDFETIPGAAPKEGLLISKQFEQTHGITFNLEDGTSPRLAAVGRPATAFFGPPRDNAADTPAANQGVGQFFLTDDGSVDGLKSSPLLVRYSPPTADASGVLLDVDYDETFTIEALDAKSTLLSTLSVKAKEPNTGDGIATRWSVSHETADIATIRVVGRRTAGGRFGLAFDLFCARGRSAGAVLQLSLASSVLFDFDKAALKPESLSAILSAASQVAAKGAGRIVVEGHTDNVGADDYNDRLSLERAESVVKLLSGASALKGYKIESVGYGARRPLVSNETDSGRQRNRRVEIVLLPQ
jgi:outer membrane protein OmpA-like peptidoglycan-associated protein